jgi:uncharacterized protein YukE
MAFNENIFKPLVTFASPELFDSISSGAGSQNMSFDGVTEGIDRDAMKTYLENLKVELLDTVSEQIENVQDVIDTINAGWQGAARDAFLKQYATQRRVIKTDLSNEYKDLMARFTELQDFYYKQDEQMMDIVNGN